MKVKLFSEYSSCDLEESINQWLGQGQFEKIIDIKYQLVGYAAHRGGDYVEPVQEFRSYTAMIIYQ